MDSIDQLKQKLAKAEALALLEMTPSNLVNASHLRSLLMQAEIMEMKRTRPNRRL